MMKLSPCKTFFYIDIPLPNNSSFKFFINGKYETQDYYPKKFVNIFYSFDQEGGFINNVYFTYREQTKFINFVPQFQNRKMKEIKLPLISFSKLEDSSDSNIKNIDNNEEASL